MLTKHYRRKLVYSGPASEKFWENINKFKDIDHDLWNELYGLGCDLQNIESTFWRRYQELKRESLSRNNRRG